MYISKFGGYTLNLRFYPPIYMDWNFLHDPPPKTKNVASFFALVSILLLASSLRAKEIFVVIVVAAAAPSIWFYQLFLPSVSLCEDQASTHHHTLLFV